MSTVDPVEMAARVALCDLVRLQLAGGFGARFLERLVRAFGSLEAALAAPSGTLQARAGLRVPLAARIATSSREHALREIERARERGVRLLPLGDADYPPALAAIPDPPLVLYVRGALVPDAARIAVVGSRRASGYGRAMARRIGADLARAGVCVVSGLALGIDGLAHEAALEAGGRTVAVLPCGLDRVYPRRHARLAEQIAAHGALVSELPLGTRAAPYQFPRRNRIVSGLAAAVCVVEARERSGSLITARWALEQDREVLAVPGRVGDETAVGTLALLEQGAAPALGAHSLLDAVGWRVTHTAGGRGEDRGEGASAVPGTNGADAASASDNRLAKALGEPGEVRGRVLASLAEGELDLDTIVARSGLAVSQALGAITELELAGAIEAAGAGRYRRCGAGSGAR
ncbi:MAG: DNA-protecting protein DprA [Planctomycetota bacterium]|nr:MAG: DNA-protecting protein DprA [Planctomycetota bacterium]